MPLLALEPSLPQTDRRFPWEVWILPWATAEAPTLLINCDKLLGNINVLGWNGGRHVRIPHPWQSNKSPNPHQLSADLRISTIQPRPLILGKDTWRRQALLSPQAP